MSPEQAIEILQQYGIGPDEFSAVAEAVQALSSMEAMPGEGEPMPEPEEQDPYKTQIAQQLARGR